MRRVRRALERGYSSPGPPASRWCGGFAPIGRRGSRAPVGLCADHRVGRPSPGTWPSCARAGACAPGEGGEGAAPSVALRAAREVRPGERPRAHRGDVARGRARGCAGPGVLSPSGRPAGPQRRGANALVRGAFVEDPGLTVNTVSGTPTGDGVVRQPWGARRGRCWKSG